MGAGPSARASLCCWLQKGKCRDIGNLIRQVCILWVIVSVPICLVGDLNQISTWANEGSMGMVMTPPACCILSPSVNEKEKR